MRSRGQQPRRARPSRAGLAAPPARAGDGDGRDPDRSGKRLVRPRHEARPRLHGRAARRLRPRRRRSPTGRRSAPSRHIEGATIATGCEVGPFARLRPGAEIGEDAKVGNFVEVKKATLGTGAKANHLSYIGDADIGANANIGAGTITCNYDGFVKYRTVIGDGAFIGSNSALVAPVTIGAGAIVGAGSVITKDVDADSLAVERSEQRGIAGWAKQIPRTDVGEEGDWLGPRTKPVTAANGEGVWRFRRSRPSRGTSVRCRRS